MRYLSLFSGIEAATQAWSHLGWEAVAFSEIEPFPCEVLKQRHPDVPNLGDITKITESQIKNLGHIDLVVFGSPCQDLSIAGKRKGLDGERSGLFTTAIKVIKWARKHCGARFALWENVPGAFSSNGGKDFGEVIKLLSGANVECQKWATSGVAIGKEGLTEWRVLDAQFFGVPQRRRRIFALADFGDWTDRKPILFESEGVCRDIEKSKKEAKGIAADAGTLAANGGGLNRPAGDKHAVAFTINDAANDVSASIAPTLRSGGDGGVVHQAVCSKGMQVRRLTPIECERLQGFPDNHTKIAYRNKDADNCPDSPRYKALGNSMSVPVMKWIGERIEANQ